MRYKDTVIITASEEAHAVVALDKKTGKEVWRAPGAALEYVFGTPALAGSALCLDAKSGEQVFKERLPGASASGRGGKPFYASAVLANGNIYVVSRRNGTFVIEASRSSSWSPKTPSPGIRRSSTPRPP